MSRNSQDKKNKNKDKTKNVLQDKKSCLDKTLDGIINFKN